MTVNDHSNLTLTEDVSKHGLDSECVCFLLGICNTSVVLSILLVVAYITLSPFISNKILTAFVFFLPTKKETQMNKHNGTCGAIIFATDLVKFFLKQKVASCS